jgi:hypothetical protein
MEPNFNIVLFSFVCVCVYVHVFGLAGWFFVATYGVKQGEGKWCSVQVGEAKERGRMKTGRTNEMG